jgi:hypothetical protein
MRRITKVGRRRVNGPPRGTEGGHLRRDRHATRIGGVPASPLGFLLGAHHERSEGDRHTVH